MSVTGIVSLLISVTYLMNTMSPLDVMNISLSLNTDRMSYKSFNNAERNILFSKCTNCTERNDVIIHFQADMGL